MAEPHTTFLYPQPLPPPTNHRPQKPHKTTAKPLARPFLCRALLFVLFIALLPLFPSQSPDDTTNGILSRTWELLQLLVVGIVISYGFFSCRNTDDFTEKDLHHNKATESTNSYVNQLLYVSPVFDDEDGGVFDENAVHTWSSQKCGNEAVTLVANGGRNSRRVIENKPLLLPVRSLRLSEKDPWGSLDEGGFEESVDRRKVSREDGVLRSPIPWRSRSGKADTEVETELDSITVSSPRSSRSTGFNGDASASRSSSFRSLREKRFHSSSSPPPAPPPPPAFTPHFYQAFDKRTVTAKSLKDELKDIAKPRSVRTVRAKDVQIAAMGTVDSEQAFGPSMRYDEPAMESEFSKRTVGCSDDSEGVERGEESAKPAAEARGEENEVDKKADEFIAKFREQIRLQRIQSIKRSAGQRSTAKNTK